MQRRLREVPGVSALVYDQTCAAEKRRRRKHGAYPDPDERVVINELVCEGCGDCGVASNCVAIQPVETEFGRKRRIDQSACNKDFSCLKGFCPSFVTVKGGRLRKASAPGDVPFPVLPEPDAAGARRPLRHPGHRRRRHRRDHGGGPARHGGPPRGQGCRRARHDRHGPEGRRRPDPPEDRAHPGRDRRTARRGRRRRGWSWAAIWSSPPAPRRCRPCAAASTAAVVNLELLDDRRLHPRPRPRLSRRAGCARRSSTPPARP